MEATEAIPELTLAALDCLRTLAQTYVWWKTPDEAMQFPSHVAAQVMNLGTWDDLLILIDAVGEDYLRHVLRTAEVGQLNQRSWNYWHYRLGLARLPDLPVPPLPVRKIV
jgi:hypothetical protein